MIRIDALLLIAHAFAGFGWSSDSSIDRLVNFRHRNGVFVEPDGENRSLVQDIVDISARETDRSFRQSAKIHGRIDFFVSRMHFEDGFSSSAVRQRNGDDAVKTSWTEQGWIKDIVSIGRGDD